MASHLPTLHQVTQHHHHSTLPVIDRLPEISGSGLHGTLSYDEGSLLLVALGGFAAMIINKFIPSNVTWIKVTVAYVDENGIDVVRMVSSQSHSPLVSWGYYNNRSH